MKSAVLVLAVLAAFVKARIIVLGDFEVLDPFSMGLGVQPQIWLNGADGASPDSGIMALGSVTTNGPNGQLCSGQLCPLSFSFSLCSGQLLRADGNSATFSVSGLGYNTPNLLCHKDNSFTRGGIGDTSRFQSWYGCNLDDAEC